jgi:hypothetical protein
MRTGYPASPVTLTIIETASSGSRLARSVAVVTPWRTQSLAKRRKPSSSLANASRSKPTWWPTIVIASGPFSSPVGIPSGPSGMPGWLTPCRNRPDSSSARVLTFRIWPLACMTPIARVVETRSKSARETLRSP